MDQFRPSKELRHSILKKILVEEQRRARKYLVVSSGIALASVVGMIFAIKNVIQAASQSSLYQYVTLVFSDPDIIASYWKDFVFSVVESVPFSALTVVLATVAALMVSLKLFVGNKGRSFSFSFNN